MKSKVSSAWRLGIVFCLILFSSPARGTANLASQLALALGETVTGDRIIVSVIIDRAGDIVSFLKGSTTVSAGQTVVQFSLNFNRTTSIVMLDSSASKLVPSVVENAMIRMSNLVMTGQQTPTAVNFRAGQVITRSLRTVAPSLLGRIAGALLQPAVIQSLGYLGRLVGAVFSAPAAAVLDTLVFVNSLNSGSDYAWCDATGGTGGYMDHALRDYIAAREDQAQKMCRLTAARLGHLRLSRMEAFDLSQGVTRAVVDAGRASNRLNQLLSRFEPQCANRFPGYKAQVISDRATAAAINYNWGCNPVTGIVNQLPPAQGVASIPPWAM